MTETSPLLSVRNLKKHYPITRGVLKRETGRVYAVDGVSFDINRGETVGLVGESGCGKSTVARTLLQLEEPTGGHIIFDGNDTANLTKDQRKSFRRRVQMIFQDPTSSLDPRMTVGESVAEPLRVHGMRESDRRRRIVSNLLDRLGLTADDANRYPHEFSGGQKQRIALARALVVNPDLIVADEPVSALDVSVQASILALMEEVQHTFDLSLLVISHDMGVVRQICDRVAVMYLGKIVEMGPLESVFDDPKHPYTRALLASVLRPNPARRGTRQLLSGDVPDPADPPSGCRFHTRCPEIIQPVEYSFDQRVWRGIMDLRERLENHEIDPDVLKEFAVAEGEAMDAMSVRPSTLKSVVRGEFDLPHELGDTSAESVLSNALDYIVEGNAKRAQSLLRTEFQTPCEFIEPDLLELGEHRKASCHLHNPEIDQADRESIAN